MRYRGRERKRGTKNTISSRAFHTQCDWKQRKYKQRSSYGCAHGHGHIINWWDNFVSIVFRFFFYFFFVSCLVVVFCFCFSSYLQFSCSLRLCSKSLLFSCSSLFCMLSLYRLTVSSLSNSVSRLFSKLHVDLKPHTHTHTHTTE